MYDLCNPKFQPNLDRSRHCYALMKTGVFVSNCVLACVRYGVATSRSHCCIRWSCTCAKPGIDGFQLRCGVQVAYHRHAERSSALLCCWWLYEVRL